MISPPPRKGRGARAIGGETLGAVDGAVQEDGARAGADARVPAQGDRGGGGAGGERTIRGRIGAVKLTVFSL